MKNIIMLVMLSTATFCYSAAFTTKAAGNWGAGGQTTWNEVGVPGQGDTVTLTHVIDMNCPTIPIGATSMTNALTKINGAGGQLVVDLDAAATHDIATIYCTWVQGNARPADNHGMLYVKGTAHNFILNCGTERGDCLVGGSNSISYGLDLAADCNAIINGGIQGGIGENAYGLLIDGANALVIINGNLHVGDAANAVKNDSAVLGTQFHGNWLLNTSNPSWSVASWWVGVPARWANTDRTHYIEMLDSAGTGKLYFAPVPTAAELISASQVGPITGTYHAPDASEVWHTAVFGPLSATNGTKNAATITSTGVGGVLAAADIRKDIVIDATGANITGTYPVKKWVATP